jgi:hypothetical protein
LNHKVGPKNLQKNVLKSPNLQLDKGGDKELFHKTPGFEQNFTSF